MKRMYVTLAVILLALIWAISSLGQKVNPVDQEFEQMKRRMELREEMHRRIRDKILRGFGSDQDIFQGMDQMFEDSFSDPFITKNSANFSTEWAESQNGRTLIVTPKSKDQQLDIDVNQDLITISGKTEQKTPDSAISSSFSNSFTVPHDCDSGKVKMDHKNGKIYIEFPFKTTKSITVPPKQNERKPLPPSEGDVTI